MRFLPEYDNLWLAHAVRTRVIDDEHRRRLRTANGRSPCAVLVDGRVRATWELTTTGTARGGTRRATVVVTPLERLSAAERRAVLAEGERAVRFLGDDADAHEVHLAE